MGRSGRGARPVALRGFIFADGDVLDAHIVDGHLVIYTHGEVASFDISDRDAPLELDRLPFVPD